MQVHRNVCAWVVAGLCSVGMSAHAGVYDQALKSGVAYLVATQAQDGSWQSAATFAQSRYLETSEAVLALQAANQRSANYYNGISWLENHAATNTDYRSRRLMALVGHQSSAAEDIKSLQGAQWQNALSNGGYGASDIYAGSIADTALALQGLKQAGVLQGTSKGVAYLKSMQRPTDPKGWPVAANGDFDAITTAQVVMALIFYMPDASLDAPVADGLAALKANVSATSPIRVRALTALAYIRAGKSADPYTGTLISSVLSGQNTVVGSWGDTVLDTSIALRALAAAAQKDIAADMTQVSVPDDQLRMAINAQLGRNAMDQLNQGEIKQLTTLNAANMGISSLDGLQYAVNLVSADLSNNQISSVRAISRLPGYPSFLLSGNPLPGAAPLQAAVVRELQLSSSAPLPAAVANEPQGGDVPLPAWALWLLAGSLTGGAARFKRRH